MDADPKLLREKRLLNSMWTDQEIKYRNTLYEITMYEKELDELDKKCRKCGDKYKCITQNTYYYNGCKEKKRDRTHLALKELEWRVQYILENADEILKLKNIHWQHKLRVYQLKGCFPDK